MGCHLQKHLQGRVTDVRYHQPTEAITTDHDKGTNPLTERQCHLIGRTWRILADDMTGRGVKIFCHVFELYPDLQQIFPFRDTPPELLVKDPRFRGHSSRFMQAIGAAVDNIDDWEGRLTPLLVELGEQHAHMAGFDLKFFDVFGDIMMDVWRGELGRKLTPEVEKAWRVVFAFLMDRLRDGYLVGKEDAVGEAGSADTPVEVLARETETRRVA